MKKLGVIMVLLNLSFKLNAYELPNECIRLKMYAGLSNFKNKTKELKELGLFYCLGFKDEDAIKKRLHLISANRKCYNYVQIMDAYQAFEEVKQYIDNIKSEYKDKDPTGEYDKFKRCMFIYDSEEGEFNSYQKEVERIVKKYCKDEDCEW